MPQRYEIFPFRFPVNAPSRRPAFSIVEMLMTAVLVGIMTIGIVPLFTQAIASNAYGADASQLAAFMRSGSERVNQRSANASAFGIDSNEGIDPSTTEEDAKVFTDAFTLRSIPVFFDTGPRAANKADAVLGDEAWIDDPADADGVLLWRQRRELREYAFADIFSGNISVAGGSLSPYGNPKLFDVPQERTGRSDLTGFRTIIESTRGGIGIDAAKTPSGFKQMASVNQYRAF